MQNNLLVALLVLIFQPAWAAPPTFVCDGTPYPTFGSSPSTLQRIDKQTLAITDIAQVSPSGTLNATGYNILDDYIYGLQGKNFFQLAADGSYIMLGQPVGVGNAAGVNWNIGITYAGTMDTSGNWYGHDRNYVYRVNIGIDPSAGDLTYERFPRSGYTGVVADLSFNPLDGNLYGMSGSRLRKITNTGVGSTVTTSGTALSGNAGGAWSTSSGVLYFYNNGSGLLYSIDMTQSPPVVSFVGNVASNGTFDATACTPPTLSKGVNPQTVVAGEQFTYNFKLTNPYTNSLVVEFTDNLPAGITFVSGSLSPPAPGSGTVTTFNANTLVISNLTIPVGLPPDNEVTFTEQAVADADIVNTLIVPNQAQITYGVNTTVSDDPDSGPIEDPTAVTIYATDWGDAPASYNDAKHVLSTTTHFMGTAPDGDTQTQNTANGGLDGSGDDDTADADEDGVQLNGISLQDQSLTNGMSVTLTVNTNDAARLHGWVDWDRDGTFGNTGNELIVSETANNTGPRTLTITPPNGLSPGNSYARFRYSTDSAAASPFGTASDGEVEDYRVQLFAGYTVSGRVYQDSNVDSINDANEAGIAGSTVVLYDTANNSCISTYTNANGDYLFDSVLSGSYQVYEAGFESVPMPQNCGIAFAKDPSGYLSTTANVSPAFTINNSAVSATDFGNIQPPLFELDNSKTILPNTSVLHPHVFTARSDGQVSFSLSAETAAPANLVWGRQLLRDNNCNGAIDSGDTTMPGSISVGAGQKVCLLFKVLSPANASAGASHILEVQSHFTFGMGSSGLAANIQTHTDRTLISANDVTNPDSGAGSLRLIKLVWNISRNAEGDFATPGETLRYTITYTNVGNGPLNNLMVSDSVPAFTQLISGTMSCANKPAELPLCSTHDNSAGNLEWVWTVTAELLPGSSGSVSYQVTIE